MTLEVISEKVSRILLEAGAVRINVEHPFTYASGMRSPIYTDNRLLLSNIHARNNVASFLIWMAKAWTAELPYQVAGIAATATAGIPWGAMVADATQAPMVYVRSKPKDHGKGNMVEGQLDRDLHYIVVEDLVTTGGSAMNTVQQVSEFAGGCLGCLCIFSYGMHNRLQEMDVELKPLTTLNALLKTGEESGLLTSEQVEHVKDWRSAPDRWYTKHFG